MDRMLVKVEAVESGADLDALSTELASHLRNNLGVRLETEVQQTGTMPRYELKTKRIFDSRSEKDRPVISLGRA